MQFTEKRLRVKWYGGFWCRVRATPALVRSTVSVFRAETIGPYRIVYTGMQRRGCHVILTAVGC
jgi:hypothetical protein